MNGYPLVSVIMSVYNASTYLTESIDSILNQTYTNIEFIIIDDGSSDNSYSILSRYAKIDKRIQLVSRENRGLPYSLNEAIGLSKGEYIVRMDADDISLPSRIDEQVRYMELNKEVGVSGTWAEVFGENNKNKTLKHPESHNELIVKLIFSVCFVHPSVIIRKCVLDRFEILYNEIYACAQDYEIWYRLSKVTRFGNIPKVLIKYRENEQSITAVTSGRKSALRYNLIKDVFSKVILDLKLTNDQEEERIHYIVASNARMSATEINIYKLDKYFNKIIMSNISSSVYEDVVLKKFLGRKLLVATYYSAKHNKINILYALKSRLFYRGIFNLFFN